MKLINHLITISIVLTQLVLGITINEEKNAEEQFIDLLSKNELLMNQIYDNLPSSEHGKVLNIDFARMLYAPFNDGNIGGYTYSNSTQKGASQFINNRFNKEIPKIGTEDSTPAVIFLAGGGGSGKSLAPKMLPEVFDTADLILDGTLKSFSKTKAQIDYALKYGLVVYVIYVHRPIGLAVAGMINRAKQTGRTVPLKVLAEAHFYAQETMLKLMNTYKNEVHFYVLDNSFENYESAQIVKDPVRFLERVKYASKEEAINEAKKSYLEQRDVLNTLPKEAIKGFEEGLENIEIKN